MNLGKENNKKTSPIKGEKKHASDTYPAEFYKRRKKDRADRGDDNEDDNYEDSEEESIDVESKTKEYYKKEDRFSEIPNLA